MAFTYLLDALFEQGAQQGLLFEAQLVYQAGRIR